jgi:pilus assembly protein CpaB
MMRFDRRFVFVLAASLAWGGIVAGAFYRVAGGGGKSARAESTKPVVVAAKALPAGATLDKASVKLRNVPESMFPTGAFPRIEDVLDRPVISPIQPDEPVVEARIAAKGSGMGLAPLIPAGMRAISVRVNDVVGVSGFILPGMRVDVLVTGRPPNEADTVTRTVLQNIAVLSAGQSIQTDGKSQSMIVPVVTLLVEPREAEALTLANIEGHIQLVLRNSADAEKSPTQGKQLHELYGAARPAVEAPRSEKAPAAGQSRRPAPPKAAHVAAAAEAAVVPAPEPDQMIIIRGATRKVEIFARDGADKGGEK